MTVSIARLFMVFAICVCVTRAQDARTASRKSGDAPHSSQGAVAGAPQPAPTIQSLVKALTGKWVRREKYEPMYLTPTGGVGKGEQVFRQGAGGFTLLEVYHSKTPAGELFGSGVLWWDQTKGLQHLWCINLYPTGCEMFPAPPQPGPKWDGKRLVIHIEGEGEDKLTWQEIISDVTANSFTQTVDIGESGGPMKRWLTMHSTKIADATKSL
jgi:hypothetical protein